MNYHRKMQYLILPAAVIAAYYSKFQKNARLKDHDEFIKKKKIKKMV